MDNQYPFTITEEARAQRHACRLPPERSRAPCGEHRLLLRIVPVLCLTLAAIAALAWSRWDEQPRSGAKAAEAPEAAATAPPPLSTTALEPAKPALPAANAATLTLTDQIISEYAILIDLEQNAVLAQKSPGTVIHPASMTKILTVLVAAENVEDMEGTAVIDRAITDYCFSNDCSVVGFLLDEEVPVKDLFYGTILSSGADAALALANYVAGSHEAFVALMNEKVEALGLSDTAHFTNCVGLYDEENVCTVSDMAMILKAAMENELCREVLTTKVYFAPPTEAFPEERVLSNWFLRRIEDKDSGDITVLGAKTGYVVQSGNCAASFAQDSAGNIYLCVTAKATSNWNAIYDHVALYKDYTGAGQAR